MEGEPTDSARTGDGPAAPRDLGTERNGLSMQRLSGEREERTSVKELGIYRAESRRRQKEGDGGSARFGDRPGNPRIPGIPGHGKKTPREERCS